MTKYRPVQFVALFIFAPIVFLINREKSVEPTEVEQFRAVANAHFRACSSDQSKGLRPFYELLLEDTDKFLAERQVSYETAGQDIALEASNRVDRIFSEFGEHLVVCSNYIEGDAFDCNVLKRCESKFLIIHQTK